MIQDIAPHIYHNEISFQTPAPTDYVLYFSPKHSLYVCNRDGLLRLPELRELSAPEASLQYLFSIDSRAYYLMQDAFRICRQAACAHATRTKRCLPVRRRKAFHAGMTSHAFAAAAVEAWKKAAPSALWSVPNAAIPSIRKSARQ